MTLNDPTTSGSLTPDIPLGIPFIKMTGSGNDFVFFDGRQVPLEAVTKPEVIRAICNRRNGIGADGLVVLEPGNGAILMHYFNADGSPADLCGNATLCATAIAPRLGLIDSGCDVRLKTPAGVIEGTPNRVGAGSHFTGSNQPTAEASDPEIAIGTVFIGALESPIDPGRNERRVGFAIAGIPHLVVLTDDVASIALEERGPELRYHQATGAAGANVNWVQALPDGSFRYRTYERGVEGETLACGTGAVATAAQLVEWGLARSPVRIISSSGLALTVTLETIDDRSWNARLSGEGRAVFEGVTRNILVR